MATNEPIGGWVYFDLLPDHIKVFRRVYIDWNDCETGAPCIDPKRPYGNSDVAGDVCELLGWTMEGDDGHDKCWSSTQRELARELHDSTRDALQVILNAQSFEPGRYRKGRYGGTWEKA